MKWLTAILVVGVIFLAAGCISTEEPQERTDRPRLDVKRGLLRYDEDGDR